MTPAQIKHMVERFLRWKLPENFRPDGGISFTSPPMGCEPSGTNLLDATQAEAMVRYMVDGLPSAVVEVPQDAHLCPRRQEAPVLPTFPKFDTWKANDWGARSTDSFPIGHPQPRICSFCGGAHPDDVVVLLRDHNWEVMSTGKRYKRYLNPPTTQSVVPPVKVYTQHFSKEQAEAFNAQVRARQYGQ